MTLFEDREQAFERLFAHEEDLRFRACAKRDRKLALWAAARMSLPGDEAEAYEIFIVRLGAWYGADGVRERILYDLQKAGVPVSDHRVRRMMDEWFAQALAAQKEPPSSVSTAQH